MINYEEKVRKVLCSMTGCEEQECQGEAKLVDLGLDSLKNVEFAIMLEDELGMRFDDSLLTQRNFETVQTVMELVKQMIGG